MLYFYRDDSLFLHKICDVLHFKVMNYGEESFVEAAFIYYFHYKISDLHVCRIGRTHIISSDISQHYGIRAMPTFVLIKEGREMERIQGANPQALELAINKLVSFPISLLHYLFLFLNSLVYCVDISFFFLNSFVY